MRSSLASLPTQVIPLILRDDFDTWCQHDLLAARVPSPTKTSMRLVNGLPLQRVLEVRGRRFVKNPAGLRDAPHDDDAAVGDLRYRVLLVEYRQDVGRQRSMQGQDAEFHRPAPFCSRRNWSIAVRAMRMVPLPSITWCLI